MKFIIFSYLEDPVVRLLVKLKISFDLKILVLRFS